MLRPIEVFLTQWESSRNNLQLQYSKDRAADVIDSEIYCFHKSAFVYSLPDKKEGEKAVFTVVFHCVLFVCGY